MKHKIIAFFLLILLFLIASCSNNNVNNDDIVDNLNDGKVKVQIFKSSSCGCCDAYSKYTGKNEYNVEVNDVQDMSKIKNQYGVPSEIESCHTMIVGDYFVEGHVPLEAVEKMILEKPNIKGIGISGMPAGSPGMPGTKSGVWTIQAINMDGSLSEFMTIWGDFYEE